MQKKQFFELTHLPTQFLSNSATHFFFNFPTYLLSSSPKLTNSPTLQTYLLSKLTYSPTHLLSNSPTLQVTYSPTQLLSDSPTLQLTYSPAHLLSNSPTLQLTYSLSHQHSQLSSGPPLAQLFAFTLSIILHLKL